MGITLLVDALQGQAPSLLMGVALDDRRLERCAGPRLVALNLMAAEVATAYAALFHAIELIVVIPLGDRALSMMNISLGEVLAEARASNGKGASKRLPPRRRRPKPPIFRE